MAVSIDFGLKSKLRIFGGILSPRDSIRNSVGNPRAVASDLEMCLWLFTSSTSSKELSFHMPCSLYLGRVILLEYSPSNSLPDTRLSGDVNVTDACWFPEGLIN